MQHKARSPLGIAQTWHQTWPCCHHCCHLQAACFARLAGSDAALVRITLSLAEKALQLQPDNPHYVSAWGGVQDTLLDGTCRRTEQQHDFEPLQGWKACQSACR